jgi:hypothetical protein
MSDYKSLENLLASIMSVEVGLSEEREKAALAISLADPAYRDVIKAELERAFQNTNLSWIKLLDNETYCVFPADSEEEARDFIKEKLWDKILSF